MAHFRVLKSLHDADLKLDKADKYKVKFVRTVSGTPNVIAVKNIRRNQSEVYNRNSAFPIDFNRPTYRQKNTYFYIFDVEAGQMNINARGKIVSPSLNHLILRRSGIRQLIMGMEKRKFGDIIIYIILAIAVGVMAGFLLHMGITTGVA